MSLLEYLNLGNGFRKYFRIDPALDGPLLDAAFEIRHQVYCEELKFEPLRPDRRETDAFDAHSLHCVMRTVHEPWTPVGCVRLVKPDPARSDAPLPFEGLCAGLLDRSVVDTAALPRDRIAEVSRLAVRRAFRRRKGEDRSPVSIGDEDFGTRERPRFPYIAIGLYMGAVSLAAHRGIDTIFVLTEPRLAKHFAGLGMDVKQIGAPIEHRGARVPSMLDVKRCVHVWEHGWNVMVRPLWREVDAQVARGLAGS